MATAISHSQGKDSKTLLPAVPYELCKPADALDHDGNTLYWVIRHRILTAIEYLAVTNIESLQFGYEMSAL